MKARSAAGKRLRGVAGVHPALKRTIVQMELARVVAMLVAVFLEAQNAECDADAARVLRRCICDPLFVESEALRKLRVTG